MMLAVIDVESNQNDIDLTRRHFVRQASHLELVVQPDGDAALAWLSEPEHHADVVLLDLRMPGMFCLELLAILKARYTLPSIILTGQGDETVAAQAMNLGAIDFIIKAPGYLIALPGAIQYAHVLAQLSCARAQDITSV